MSQKHSSRVDLGLFLIRAMVAVVFLYHGSQKLFGLFDGGGLGGTASAFEGLGLPLPRVSALLAGLTELVGGLALLTGAWLRLMAPPLVFTMLVAAFVAHGDAFAARQGGLEYPLTLAVVVSGLALTGPGRFALALGGPRA